MYDVGSVVAGHQLVAPLGSGPFGRVFRAEGPHGPVAVKLLKPGFLGRPDGMAAFGRLGASVAVHSQLRHPYLARTYDVIEDRGPSAFGQVTEVLEGQTLAEVQVEDTSLKGQDPLGLAGVLTWYEQLGDVLAWLHAQSMVHGNLKPTNVMRISLAGEHHVKLLDVSWSSIGVAAVPAGPTSYVAPEQYQGSIPTPRSDQWALATMLERTFTRGHHRLALGVLPAALVQAVQRATQDEPEARFPVLNEFVETIREIRVELQRTGGADVAPQHDAKTLPAGSVPSDLAGGRPGSGGPTTDLDAIPEPVVVDPSQDTGLSRGTAPGMQMPSVSVDGRVTRPADAEIKSSRIGESTVEGMMPLRRHDISGLLEEESGMIPEVSVPSGRSIPPPASTVRGFAPASHRMPRPPTVADPGSTVAGTSPPPSSLVRAGSASGAPRIPTPAPAPAPVVPPAPPFAAGPRAATIVVVIAAVAAGAATLATFPELQLPGRSVPIGSPRAEAAHPPGEDSSEEALTPSAPSTRDPAPLTEEAPVPSGPLGAPDAGRYTSPAVATEPSTRSTPPPETLAGNTRAPVEAAGDESRDPVARCAAGSAWFCAEAGRQHASAGRWGEAARAFEKACAPQRSWSCYRAARIFDRQAGEAQRAEALFRTACQGGRKRACVLMSSRTTGEESVRWTRRACALGDVQSCSKEEGAVTSTRSSS